MRDYKLILFPVNVKKCHWFLVVADIPHQKFYIVDSMESSHGDTNVKPISIFLKDYLSLSNVETWPVKVPENVPKQGNGYDCGLCSCLNMEIMSR